MKKNSQYLEEILESIEIKKKLLGLNKEVFLSIEKTYKNNPVTIVTTTAITTYIFPLLLMISELAAAT
jgi:hypothetical protein